jgi:hypothetical protein
MPYKDPEKRKENKKKYYQNNKNKISEYKKEWYQKNKEKILKKSKQWQEKNKERCRENHNNNYKKRNKTDIKFNLNRNIGKSIGKSLKGNKSGYHWETLVGYTVNDLKKRLQKTMPEGYTWQDYLEGKLHIDHIIPKSVFNFDNYNQIDFQRCWALDNLQLLPAEENLRKHAKLSKLFQPSLKI